MAQLIEHTVELAARLALDESPIYLLRKLSVRQVDEAIEITGCVDSYYHKQLAQELVRLVSSDLHLINSVEVARG